MLYRSAVRMLPREDVNQCVALADASEVSINSCLDRLARDLGWRRVKDQQTGRRYWLPETKWLALRLGELGMSRSSGPTR